MKRAIKIITILIGILSVLILTALFYYLSVTKNEKLDRDKLTLNTRCIRLYDGSGAEMQSANKQSAAPYSSFPQALPNAFVAVEDKNFYRHNGFDYKRIVKAAMKNVASFSFSQGASTISQQLIKNTHLTGEKTINRKLKEFKLTQILENRYSIEVIMELYLNSIFFGHSAFGIRDAARYYFGKAVEDLAPADCAMLAALVKSPNRYSPFKEAEKCLARRNLVLSLMQKQGYLTDAEYTEAINTPLPATPVETAEDDYVTRVYEELTELFPDIGSDNAADLRVYTFCDRNLQSELNKLQAESDFSVLVRDNVSHGIKAIRATAGALKRLPASAIKPLLVYAPAFEENIVSPLTPILDQKTDFGGYSPDDYGGATNGYVSVRQAIAKSINIPAVKILNELGAERGAAYLKKMNLDIPEEDYSLALALGGMKEGFTLPALADGYATFANQGNFAPSRTIARIEDGRGKTLYRFMPAPQRVFSEDVSCIMNDVLQTTVQSGTAKKLKTLPFPVCAKTGTGGTDAGNTDAYTISYTKNDVVAVWMGNRDNTPITATGGGLPANMALRVWKSLYTDSKPDPFPVCDDVVTLDYDLEEYETNQKILIADPLAPVYTRGTEIFRKSNLPLAKSEKFTLPNIETPKVSVKNQTVYFELCQTKYYDYVIKRENRGKTTTIYNGKYQKTICDNSVRAGESYRYTVIPIYNGTEGRAVVLPLVRIPKTNALPDEWWD